jgi:hypothetical protein
MGRVHVRMGLSTLISKKGKFDELVKSDWLVMPDSIRYPERIDTNGFRPSPE